MKNTHTFSFSLAHKHLLLSPAFSLLLHILVCMCLIMTMIILKNAVEPQIKPELEPLQLEFLVMQQQMFTGVRLSLTFTMCSCVVHVIKAWLY